MPPLLVIMGVAGSGKSTVGARVAAQLGVVFQEGDALHDLTSVARMRSGQPLDDEARRPWLGRIAAWLDQQIAARQGGVITCSALRRSARALLARPQVRLIFLDVSTDVLTQRVSDRAHAFMPAALLPSQLMALENPADHEAVLTVDGSGNLEQTVARVLAAVRA